MTHALTLSCGPAMARIFASSRPFFPSPPPLFSLLCPTSSNLHFTIDFLSLPSLKNQKKLDLARRDPLQESSWAMRTPSFNLHANTKLMRLGPSFYALSRTPLRMTPLAFMPLQLHMDTRILAFNPRKCNDHRGALQGTRLACGKVASAVTSEWKWFPSWEGRGRLILTADQGDTPSLHCSLCAGHNLIGGPVNQTSGPNRTPNGQARSIFDPPPIIVTRYGPRCWWKYLHRSASVLAYHPTTEAVCYESFHIEVL